MPGYVEGAVSQKLFGDSCILFPFLFGGMNAGNAEVESIKAENAQLRNELNEVKKDVSGLKKDVSVIKTDMSEIKTDVRQGFGKLEQMLQQRPARQQQRARTTPHAQHAQQVQPQAQAV